MLLDITLKITPEMAKRSAEFTNASLMGHLGTHFDVMDKEFPLDYTRRKGIVFDVSAVTGRDIDLSDIDMERVCPGMFVAFCTGYIHRVDYGSQTYFSCHPQLTRELIEALLDKGVCVIGLDFAGIRRGGEHVPMDQYCADRDTFVVENLWGLGEVLQVSQTFTAHIYPMHFAGITGLPCRVVAEI